MPKSYLSARVNAATLARLARRARRLGKPKSNLIEQYLEEGLRMDEHPGVVFVDGPFGRRAALASRRGLDLWQVVKTLRDNGGELTATAEVLALAPAEVRVALGYYVDHEEEVDELIRGNLEEAEVAEDAWRRQRALLR